MKWIIVLLLIGAVWWLHTSGHIDFGTALQGAIDAIMGMINTMANAMTGGGATTE